MFPGQNEPGQTNILQILVIHYSIIVVIPYTGRNMFQVNDLHYILPHFCHAAHSHQHSHQTAGIAYGQRWSLTPSSDGHAAPHWDGCDNQHLDPSQFFLIRDL